MRIIISVIAVVIAVVIALAVRNDAEKRNMNGFLWGLFTFLLMIVALPTYFIVRKPKIR